MSPEEEAELLRKILMELLLCGERFTDYEWQEACGLTPACDWVYYRTFVAKPALLESTGGGGSFVTEAGKRFIKESTSVGSESRKGE